MGAPTLKVRQDDGRIASIPIAPEIILAARHLPHAPDRYFITENAILLPVTRLVQTRARPEGIANAVSRMAEAYAGRMRPRSPIKVERLDDRLFLVLDGNSTLSVAVAAAWPDVPCLIAAKKGPSCAGSSSGEIPSSNA